MREYNPHYDLKYIRKTLIVIGLMFLAMKVSGGAGYVLAIPFVLYALFMNKLEPLLFWMVFTNALVNTNGFFTPKGMVFSVAFRAVFVLVGTYGTLLFLSVRASKYVNPLMGVFLYLVYMFIPSSQGWAPKISYLKLVLFSLTYMALAFMSIKAAGSRSIDMRKVRSMMLAFSIVYIFGSVLVMPFHGISDMNAAEILERGVAVTSLYQGMTNHSQTLGMFTCFWTVFLFADLLFHVQKPDKLYIALLLCGLFLVVKSSTRTAMGSLLASIVFLTYLMYKIRGINIRWKSKVVSMLMMLLAVSAGAVIAIPAARDKVAKFAMKYVEEGDAKSFNMETALKTRAFLVEEQMYHFHQRPSIGWGFQVSEQVGEMAAHSTGLVLTAPVEKGVWVTAILEEGGICGLIIYSAYFLIAFCLLMARKAYMGATMFLLIHISNLGEFTMFSMSGSGGMWYALLFFALVFDAKRLTTHKTGQTYFMGRNP